MTAAHRHPPIAQARTTEALGRWILKLPNADTDRDIASVADGIYFHLWRTRQEPFRALQEGDTVYFACPEERRIIWELRARHIRADRYESRLDALDMLRESYGLFPEDLSDYVFGSPEEGWLLAWAIEVVAPLDVALPADLNFARLGARHGYLPWARLPADIEAQLQLPPPGRPGIAEPAVGITGGRGLGTTHRAAGRHIPVSVRRAVWRRDAGRCRECGTSTPPMHFDHIFPVSKGGHSDIGNLQLLCQRHNLQKAARVPPSAPVPAGAHARLLAHLAVELAVQGSPPPLAAVVAAAERANRLTEVIEGFLALLDEPDLDWGEVVTAVRGINAPDQRCQLLRVRVAAAIAADDPAAALELSDGLLDHDDFEISATAAFAVAVADPDLIPSERSRLFEIATRVADPWVAGWAHICRAELETAEDSDRARHHLELAANSPHRSPRGEAAFRLGDLTYLRLRQLEEEQLLASGDPTRSEQLQQLEVEAENWFRRALVSKDPSVVAWCAYRLAELIPGDVGCEYAKHALETDDLELRDAVREFLRRECGSDDARG